MSSLNNLTIVIPTRNRQRFAIRNMKFWSDKDVNLIVIDGSDYPLKKQDIKEDIANILYIHLTETFPKRLAWAAELLKTEYTVLLSDDEFLLPSALEKCINFLDNNLDYVACGGRSLGFMPFNNAINGRIVYPELLNRHLHESDPKKRIVNHMREYAPAFSGAVARTDIWRIVPKLYAKREFPIYALWELELNMIMSFAGKSIILPFLTRLRSYGETDPIRNNIPSLNVKNEIFNWWFDTQNRDEKEEFVSLLSESLQQIYPNYAFNCNIVVNDAINAYCDFYLSIQNRTLKAFVKKKIENRLNNRLLLIFQKVYTLYKDLSIKKKSKKTQFKIFDAAQTLNQSGVAVDFNELNKIIDLLNEFHEIGH